VSDEGTESGLGLGRSVSNQGLHELRGEVTEDGNSDLGGLGVNIADVHATLVVEEDIITVAGCVHADVELLLLLVREEGLNDEGIESTGDLTDGNVGVHALLDPSSGAFVVKVEPDKTSLASTLDELIRLGDEFHRAEPFVARLIRKADNIRLTIYLDTERVDDRGLASIEPFSQDLFSIKPIRE